MRFCHIRRILLGVLVLGIGLGILLGRCFSLGVFVAIVIICVGIMLIK